MGKQSKRRLQGKKPKSVKAKVSSKMGQKRTLSRFGKKQKKGMAGTMAEYYTRSQALKKLQITLRDFRRLCILKGIYPRDPKKKSEGQNKVYYHIKDIAYLSHEPVLEKFRDFKAFMKKIRKSIGRRELDVAKARDLNRPEYSLNHLVKERYPTFKDALNDMDDALCMIHLFASLGSNSKVKSERIQSCRQLMVQWQYYVARSRCMEKCFISIKGIYMQAKVHGVPITWVMPHQFTQVPPSDVDFNIMLTFLEFYETFMKFLLYRLYNEEGMKYPPLFDATKDQKGLYLASVKTLSISSDMDTNTNEDKENTKYNSEDSSKKSSATVKKSLTQLKSLNEIINKSTRNSISDTDGEEMNEDEINDEDMEELQNPLKKKKTGKAKGTKNVEVGNIDEKDEDEENCVGQDIMDHTVGNALKMELGKQNEAIRTLTDEILSSVNSNSNGDSMIEESFENSENLRKNLFKGFYFFLGREVPLDWVQFVIISFGGNVGWNGEGSPYNEDASFITHQVIDRPTIPQSVKNLDPKIQSKRDYIQPQWIFDSINNCMLLPIDRYTPGASLPPHLSPFVDDEQEGYVPDYRKELNKMKNPNNDDRILEEEQIQENSKQKVNDANLETIKHVGKGAKRRLGNGLQVDESQLDETDREEIQVRFSIFHSYHQTFEIDI